MGKDELSIRIHGNEFVLVDWYYRITVGKMNDPYRRLLALWRSDCQLNMGTR